MVKFRNVLSMFRLRLKKYGTVWEKVSPYEAYHMLWSVFGLQQQKLKNG